MYLGQSFTLALYVVNYGFLIKHTLIDSEVDAAPEEDEDEDDNDDEDPMPDSKQMRPPQETLDIQNEDILFHLHRKTRHNKLKT